MISLIRFQFDVFPISIPKPKIQYHPLPAIDSRSNSGNVHRLSIYAFNVFQLQRFAQIYFVEGYLGAYEIHDFAFNLCFGAIIASTGLYCLGFSIFNTIAEFMKQSLSLCLFFKYSMFGSSLFLDIFFSACLILCDEDNVDID